MPIPISRFLAAGLVLLAAACGGANAAPMPSPNAANAKAAAKEEPHGTFTRDGTVGTYVSTPWGFSTNSYVLEGPTGLVAIDTQFLPSAAEEMIQQAEEATKKKFVLAIVLHANPDKFNGTSVFQKRGVKVVTSAQIKAAMPAIHEKRVKAFYDRYKPDYPTELPAPDVFGDKTTELEAGGVKVKLHVLGAGCSEAHVVAESSGAIFTGDLVAGRAHSWLEIGKTDEWLKRIAEMRALKPSKVYPGRGVGTAATLLDDEEAYLKKVIALVAAEKPNAKLPEADQDAAVERAEKAIIAAYPDYGFPIFLKIGLPAEWSRQARLAR